MPDDATLSADITVRVTPDFREQLKQEAEDRGQTFSGYLRSILRNRHDSSDDLEGRVDQLERTVQVLQEHVVDENSLP